jgi:lysyl-tRNA synthetase class 2
MNSDFMPCSNVSDLRERAQILAEIRRFFDNRGFFEVQTPLLSRDTAVDRYIEPIEVPLSVAGAAAERFYLQTSPEFAMKRLVTAGAEAIYQMGPVFRGQEIGRLHNIEFTMLEWYRVGDDYCQGMDLLDEFGQALLGCAPAERLSYYGIIEQALGINLRSENWEDAWEKLCAVTNPDDPLEQAYQEIIEPQLARRESVILYDWPADQAALAQVREDAHPGIHRFAERFEWFVRGVELANGYHELTDARELLSRQKRNNQFRLASGIPTLPEHSRLMDAMLHGLPACCGVALGVDRLVMLRLGKTSIQEVMAFDSLRA